MNKLHLVWFKRDLRVHDNAALNAACLAAERDGGKVLALYIFEPDYWKLPQHSDRQFSFLSECLDDLKTALRARGCTLHMAEGGALDVLSGLHRLHGLTAIHCHEEIGLGWTMARNQSVSDWCHRSGVSFRQQQGVDMLRVQAGDWASAMSQKRKCAPQYIPAHNLPQSEIPLAPMAHVAPPCPQRLSGGRLNAIELLGTVCGPDQGPLRQSDADAGAALSAYLAFGTLSVREVWQALHHGRSIAARAGNTRHTKALATLINGLERRAACLHRFQDVPAFETRNLHPAHDGLRHIPDADNPAFLA